MKKYTTRQTVNIYTLDTICDRYIACGWKEVDIIGAINHPQEIIFEWDGEGIPKYPNLSDLCR